VDVREPLAGGDLRALLPRRRNEGELGVGDVRERLDVPRGVDDDLLPLECRVEVRDDTHGPPRRVGLASFGERERFGRRPVFAALVEGTALELLGRLFVELWPGDTGPVATPGCDDDPAA
jgi:hypothetical protein